MCKLTFPVGRPAGLVFVFHDVIGVLGAAELRPRLTVTGVMRSARLAKLPLPDSRVSLGAVLGSGVAQAGEDAESRPSRVSDVASQSGAEGFTNFAACLDAVHSLPSKSASSSASFARSLLVTVLSSPPSG